MIALVAALFIASGARSDDAFTMNTFRCDVCGWRITTPAGWVLVNKNGDANTATVSDVELNATRTGTKGNIVIAWHKGLTLAALKSKIDEDTKAAAAHVSKKPTLDKAGARLRAEYDVDYGGVRGRTYVVAVTGPLSIAPGSSPSIAPGSSHGSSPSIVQVTVPGAGPAADYADLKAAADAFADAVVFEAIGEKPWAHKKNVELLKAKLCSSKTASLAFDGAGHLVVEPGAAKTYYDLVGDDAKVAIPSKGGGPAATVEIQCAATERTADGHVVELVCGKTKWRADLCN